MQKEKKIFGYLALADWQKNKYLEEEFKGEVMDKIIKFPKELGAEHPFEFETVEALYKKFGLVSAAINKITDAIVGDFSVKVDNENAQAILDSFIKETDFTTKLRPWIAEGIGKGNGFMELDFKDNNLRVLNANNMYVKRNKKGKVLLYNQWKGGFNRFSKDSKELIEFTPKEIAHLPINKIPNDPYGIGIIYPNMRTIDWMLGSERDSHKLQERKAGAPIHVKVGVPGAATQPDAVGQVSNNLKFSNTSTNWVTDANVDMKMIDFGNLGQSMRDTLDHDFHMLIAGFEIPEVMFGSGQLNEGIAKSQTATFDRKIKSYRELIETIIETQILKPILNSNGFNETIRFEWNLPTDEEINLRIDKLQMLLNSFAISENMKRAIQLELAKLLKFEDAETYLLAPEAGIDEEEKEVEKELRKQPLEEPPDKPKPSESQEAKRESKIKQPEVPGAKPNANAILDGRELKLEYKEEQTEHTHECIKEHLTESQTAQMSVKEFVNIKEIPGFNYSDYLVKILQILKIDKFTNLSAINTDDITDGLLSGNEVERLRIILRDGFRKNKTIGQVEKEIEQGINLKDRLKEGKIVALAGIRAHMISRTETVRLANDGLISLYKENGIEQVRFLAALSDRTCPICEGLNGQVFSINNLEEGINKPPIHVNCRCNLLSIEE